MASLQPPANTHHSSTTLQSAPHNDDPTADTKEATDSTASMSSSASLDGLPPELFERVAELVTPEDLKALRLVCQQTEAKARRICKLVLFSQVKIMLWSEPSLRGALERTQHPTLGNAIRDIVLYDNELENPDLSYMGICTARPFLREWEEAFHVQEGVQRRGDILHSLTTILKTVPDSRKLSSLRVARCVGAEFKRQQPILAEGCYKWRNLSDIFVLRTILKAVAASDVSAETFTMACAEDDDKNITCLPLAGCGPGGLEISQCEAAFSRFKRLELSFSAAPTNNAWDVDIQSIRDLCAATFCQKIVTLNVMGAPHWSSRVEPTPRQYKELMSAKFPALESLNFLGYDLECADLVAFLGNHKSLLRVAFSYGDLRDISAHMDLDDQYDVFQEIASSVGIPQFLADDYSMNRYSMNQADGV